jgi:hypothetical protein
VNVVRLPTHGSLIPSCRAGTYQKLGSDWVLDIAIGSRHPR